jgi:hypothetical protein
MTVSRLQSLLNEPDPDVEIREHLRQLSEVVARLEAPSFPAPQPTQTVQENPEDGLRLVGRFHDRQVYRTDTHAWKEARAWQDHSPTPLARLTRALDRLSRLVEGLQPDPAYQALSDMVDTSQAIFSAGSSVNENGLTDVTSTSFKTAISHPVLLRPRLRVGVSSPRPVAAR